jgi:hypothetical protein
MRIYRNPSRIAVLERFLELDGLVYGVNSNRKYKTGIK